MVSNKMSEEVKLEVIKNIQSLLSKYIKKPPLTEKLLRKPPFRYLHDITTAVIKETGYLEGLYSQYELNPENIKDRESKIAFLEKLIAAVNLSAGTNITALPNKIVAGIDVARTNELLQTIALAVDKKIDSTKAVEEVLKRKYKGVNQKVSSKKDNSKSRTSKDIRKVEGKPFKDPRDNDIKEKKLKEKRKKGEKTEYLKTKSKEDSLASGITESAVKGSYSEQNEKTEDIFLNEKQNISSFDNVERSVTSDIISNENQLTSDISTVKGPQVSLETVPVQDISKENKMLIDSTVKEVGIDQYKLDEVQEFKQNHRKENLPKSEGNKKKIESAKKTHEKTANGQGTDSDVQKSEVKIEEKVFEEKQVVVHSKDLNTKSLHSGVIESETTVPKELKRPRTAARPLSARPGAPRIRDRGSVLLNSNEEKFFQEPVNLIVDSKVIPKNDEENLVSVDTATSDTITDKVLEELEILSQDQGHLVTQILETQKELEDTTNETDRDQSDQQVDLIWSNTLQREQALTRELERLRSAVQLLTRAANPLGKLIDFLQEDIDSMQTELETWIGTNQLMAKQFLDEERFTEDRIQPLINQLEDIEQRIEEQLEETSMVKATIIRNDEHFTKIQKINTTPHSTDNFIIK